MIIISIEFQFQLINGLIECVSVKLKSDLPSLVFDDKLFSHIVDEVLIFNKELLNIESNIFDLFPNSNLMSIFSNEPFFSRILSLEKKSMNSLINLLTFHSLIYFLLLLNLNAIKSKQIKQYCNLDIKF